VDRLGGVWTTGELLAGGVPPGRIRRLVRDGALCQLRPGVYAPAATVSSLVRDARDEKARQAGTELLRVAATLAVTGSRSVGSHRSAALVHGLGLVGGGPGSVAEITRAPGAGGSYTGRLGVRVHVAALPADHVVSYRGVLLTSVPRTVIDLARALPFAEGVAVADSALHARLTSKAALSALITDCARWPGLRRARDVTAFSDARSESVLESLSRAAFRQAGLPPPDLQVWVGDDHGVIGRADFLWRRYNTIGEADGALKYQTPARARAQLERDSRLRAAGYEVVHFTWLEITRVPAQVIDAIQVAFARSGVR
jgi:Transcriptional regulator, AbiEi antitoxin